MTAIGEAIAHPNIALIKYWGKRDEDLILPMTGSLSLTLDVFPTHTRVVPDPALTSDRFLLNGKEMTGTPFARVTRFLDIVRDRAGSSLHALVSSSNKVPTGAGLASSASGFAALAGAAAHAFDLPSDTRSLSRLARRGSGSACRSVIGGLALWHAGTDDASSFAEQVEGPDLAMVIAVVDAGQKSVSSRTAMRLTADTSPYHEGWVRSTAEDLTTMVRALAEDDFRTVGELTESNALRMHAAIQGCRPVIRYLAPVSVALFNACAELREAGLEVYGTADAGPNVEVLCRRADLETTHAELARRFPELTLIAAGSGPGTHRP